MFAEVIPLLRLHRRQTTFTYHIPPELEGKLQAGQLVRIPWRGAERDGMVFSLAKQSSIAKTQPILSAWETVPSWTPHHLATFAETAADLFTAYPNLANLFLPAIPTKIRAAVAAEDETSPNTTPLSIQQKAITAIDTFLRTNIVGHQVVRLKHHAERFYLYRQLAQRYSGQVLILTPTHDDATELATFLKRFFDNEVCCYDVRTGKNEQWRQWQAIRDGQKRIVITTRSGVFLPCRNLSTIIIDQEERSEHRQWEATPRYDSRRCAEQLAKALAIPLWSISFHPRVETAVTSQARTISSSLAPLRCYYFTPRDNDILHEQIMEKLEESQAAGQTSLIISPHKALARTLRCLDCQYAWTCPTCKRGLYEATEALACHLCGHQEQQPSECPRCHSQRLRPFGLGTAGLAKTLGEKGFTDIHLFAGDTAEAPLFAPGQIIISTPYTCKRLFMEKRNFGLIALVHPEAVLYTPTFRANELYYHLMNAHRIMATDYAQTELWVQTSLSEQNVLNQQAVGDHYEAFLNNELASRRRFQLPPFADEISIETKTTETNEELTARFRKALAAMNPKPLAVLGPFKQQDKPLEKWLIRVPPRSKNNLDKILNSIYNSATVDLNPETYLL